MNDLNNKLREAISRMWGAGIDYALSPDFKELSDDEKDALYDRYKTNVGTEVLAQIHQAYKEAGITTLGWVHEQKYAKVDKRTYRDRDGKKYTQFTISYPDGSGEFARVPDFDFMTGQEWYDHFEKELERWEDDKTYDLHPFVMPEVLRAAKKASGISETKE